ncbi:MAG: translation initiation factor IF-2 [Phycisphaerales bacterium]|nr:translation initiation factor IF-2 [Phycisphaerales bacterium]
MAKKKTIALRVHTLAKELGVSSKDIIAKCVAEDIPDITNHMSAISVGLSHTVREWFGNAEGESSTAVETAAKVDVVKARAKVRKSTKKTTVEDQSDSTTAVAEVEVADLPATKTPTITPTSPAGIDVDSPAPVVKSDLPRSTPGTPVEPALPSIAVIAAAAAATAAASAAAAEAAAEAAEAAATAATAETAETTAVDGGARSTKPMMNVPNRPENVMPVGPKLGQPTKVALAGPKVIRVEKPDDLPAPRPRGQQGGGMMSTGGPRRGGGAGEMEQQSDARRGGGGAGGPGAKGRSPRRSGGGDGRTGRAGTGLGEKQPFQPWRAQDLTERDQALKHSQGFFRQHRQDRMRGRGGGGGRRGAPIAEKTTGPVKISEPITIKELSAVTGVKGAEIVKKLFLEGIPATINSAIDTERAIEIMMEYEIELQVEEAKTAAEVIEERFKAREREDERPRSPIVTILGHVDHGKTSLLDRIRKANVAAGEAGGITQATSAFQVPVTAGDKERVVTFIDTPGHEAFTNMRARGAKVTDVVVLVVAADDGIMPQTAESISHAKAAGVPLVVALNKIDKAEATDENIQRIFGQLAEHELNPTEWGGSTEVVKTSAIEGTGIQDLLDVLDYQADLLDLKGDFTGNAEGTVLEAQIEEGRGPVARMLVQEGMLKKGDFIVTGRGFGRVRDIVDDHGTRVEFAGPSTPIAISGIDQLPDAGDRFFVASSLKEAESAAEERRGLERERELAAPKITLDNIFDHLEEGKKKNLPLVIKGDVQGSVETLRAVLGKIGSDEVKVSVKHAAVGGINESDVTLAEATGAIVLGFNVTTTAKARQLAESRGVDIRLYDVIYDITDDVVKAASGLLDPELKLEVLGHAEVKEVFRVSKIGSVAGCYVTDGVVARSAQIRVTRDGIVVEKDRRLDQLKRFKDDAKEVKSGMECGMKIDGYDDIKAGDVLECYKTISVARSL